MEEKIFRTQIFQGDVFQKSELPDSVQIDSFPSREQWIKNHGDTSLSMKCDTIYFHLDKLYTGRTLL